MMIYCLLSTDHVLAVLLYEPSSHEQRAGGMSESLLIYEHFNALLRGPMCWLPLMYLHETSVAYKAWQKGEPEVYKVECQLHGTEVLQIRPWNVHVSVWWLRKANKANEGLEKTERGESRMDFTTYQSVLWLLPIHSSSAAVLIPGQKDNDSTPWQRNIH